MFTSLPDFTPRDSHSLWYTSSRNPQPAVGSVDTLPNPEAVNNQHGQNNSRQNRHVLERSILARLAADEQNMQRRRMNVQNYGSGWLKPPGVPKTLHQLREEKREQEEHQEAMRREQLQQELAEAEADGMGEEGMMDDVQLDGAQDLDEDIPEADDDFGFRNDDSDDDSEDDEDEDDEDDDDDADEDALREERRNDLIASQIRMNDDAYREALVRGDADADDMYGGDEEVEEAHQGHIFDEEDFGNNDLDDELGMGMDADLDDDIPEAESGSYEHTDSEAELSSSEEEQDDEEEDDNDISFVPRSATLPPPRSPTFQGRSSMSAPPASMDLSNLLSQDGSSFMDSSPAAGRRARR